MAFERSAMLSAAIKNPLIYLNFAIYCFDTGKYDQADLNLKNFLNMSENMKIRADVSINFRSYDNFFKMLKSIFSI